MATTETRKLAAVMFADITGYTAMVQENEAAALAKIEIHRDALKRFTQDQGGEIIAFYGDGSLSTYSSAIDAVNCAIEMQKVYVEREVPVRIGLHLGDIVFKEGTVFGEGVNLASSIEAQGIPGSILISEKVNEELTNHPEILTKSIGHYTFKNLTTPIELFAIANPGLTVPTGKQQYGKLWRTIMRAGIAVIALMLIGYIVYDLGLLQPHSELKQEKIAVRFMDFANVEGQELLGEMASHWISNRVEEIPGSKVVKYEDANIDPNVQLATAGGTQRLKFARETGAANLLEGQIFREGDSLVFDAKIIDLGNGNVQQKFGPVWCTLTNPMAGIDEITGEIRGWWASKDLKLITIPKYDAYKAFLTARSVWLEDEVMAERKLREAIKADPTFIDPYFLLLTQFYNESRFHERDSLLAQIKENFLEMNARQVIVLKMHTADAQGDLIATYEANLQEMKFDSLDLFNNTGGMVMAMAYVNDPKKAIELFHMIPVDSLDVSDCAYCNTRIRVAMSAYMELDSIDEALALIDLLDEESLKNSLRKIQVFTMSDDTMALRNLITNAINNEYHLFETLWPYAAWQYILQGKPASAGKAARIAIANNGFGNRFAEIEAYYVLGEYDKILESADNWLKTYPSHKYILSYVARIFAHTGDANYIDRIIKALEVADENEKYDYGFHTYYRGVIEAIQGNHDLALDLLEQAYGQGHVFQDACYNYDIDLMPLFAYPRFQKLIHPTEQ